MERAWYDDKGVLHWNKVTDFSPIINENDDLQKDGTNGFSPDRSFRHVGRIPYEAFHRWAVSINYYEMDKMQRNYAVRKYLNDHPEFRTVQALVTHNANDGNVIVR